MIQRTDFSIDDNIGKIGGIAGDVAETFSPVEPLARFELNLACLNTHLDTVTVELDFMQPSCRRWWPLLRLAKLRRDEGGHRARRRSFFSGLALSLLLPLFRRAPFAAVPYGVGTDNGFTQHEWLWLSPCAGGDRRHRPARCHRRFFPIENCATVPADGFIVTMLYQQPVGPLAAVSVVFHANKHEAALQAIPVEDEFEVAFLERIFRRHVTLRLPITTVPQHDRATAIFTFRDRAFEIAVIERMVFNFDCQAFVCRIERRTARHGP